MVNSIIHKQCFLMIRKEPIRFGFTTFYHIAMHYQYLRQNPIHIAPCAYYIGLARLSTQLQ